MFKAMIVAASLVAGSFMFAGSASAINFAPSSQSPITGLGEPGVGAALGDLTDSTYPDIVSASSETASQGGGGYFIQRADGDGTFTQTLNSPVETNEYLRSVYSTDVDNDGDSDLISQTGIDNYYTYYRSDGDGNLSFAGQFYVGGNVTSPSMLAIGDVTGDGLPDLVAGSTDSKFGVTVNVGGNFVFGPPAQQAVPGTPGNAADTIRTVSIGDFNGDGFADLALGLEACTVVSGTCPDPEPSGSGIYVMEGDGTPTGFTAAPGNPRTFEPGETAETSATTTIDGIAPDSLAVGTRTSNGSGKVRTYIGDEDDFLVVNPDGSGTFGSASPPNSMVSTDLNDDGRPDLAWLEGGTEAGFSTQTAGGGYQSEAKSPVPITSGGEEFSTLSAGQFSPTPGAGLVAGGNDPATDLGVVGILLPAMDLVADPQAVEFPATGTSQTSAVDSIDLSNKGIAAGEIESLEISGPDADEFTILNKAECLGEIEAGAGCRLDLTFSPKFAGEREATISVVGTSTDLDVPLSGIATGPVVSVNPNQLDFGEVVVDQSLTRTVTVNSIGQAAATFSLVGISGPDSGEFEITSDTCTAGPTAPGASCSIEVKLTPGGTGPRAATLDLQGNALESELALPLAGTGKAPEPPAVTRVSLKLKSAKKIKRGRKLKLTAIVRNTGNVTIKELSLRTVAPKKLARKPRVSKVRTLAPGASAKRVITVRVKRNARPGKKMKLRVLATAGGKRLSAKPRVVRIRR